MLFSASGTYVLVALLAAAAGYVMAHRKGLNAVGWAWTTLFLIVPVVILPFVRGRRATGPATALPDEGWNALLAYDPEIKTAAARLRPLDSVALDELRRAWRAVPDKRALPETVSAIEARWAARAEAGLAHVETRDGIAVLRDESGQYHVGERTTGDLATARLLASAEARRTWA
ncbi:hypothetical protein MBRA_05067 [Methylobacterium brachiatum]|jgi:hypothetical protein|nr:hypothetical protein MBRA_05067 [Methylobacterium brachiatum]